MPCSPRIYIILLAIVGATLIAPGADLRVVTLNVHQGVGPIREASNQAARQVLARIDADVVALQEVHRDDLVGSPNLLQQFASALGYPHLHIAGGHRVLDQHTRVAFLSRHPFRSSTDIAPPEGALDMTRQIPAVQIDLPNVIDDPLLLNVHLKCCGDFDDPFRRAVELRRVARWFEAEQIDANDPVIILGDFNLIAGDRTYHSLPPRLPGPFNLGEDLTLPITYSPDAPSYFPNLAFSTLPSRQLNGATFTTGTSALDLILASNALTSQPHSSEIYNSALDTNNNQGLPKVGHPLDPGVSAEASDHHAVFADFTLPSAPRLQLSESSLVLGERGESRSVTVTFDPPLSKELTLNFASSDPSEVRLETSAVQLDEGTITYRFLVHAIEDELIDGDQGGNLTVTADGYLSASLAFTILDQSPREFVFSQAGQSLTKSFDHYDGSAPPAGWQLSHPLFHGRDEGNSSLPGIYSYGPSGEGALGFLLEGESMTATATYQNGSSQPLTSLSLRFDAEQWRFPDGGRFDSLDVVLRTQSGDLPLPSLGFETSPDLVMGAGNPREAEISHLDIEPGESFELIFTAQPGAESESSPLDEVFLNEFHYDNEDLDELEFIEIAVGPDFEGPLDDISIALYNGNGGGVYGSHTLDTFIAGETTASGHRLFAKFIPNVQNGSPDGIAIVVDGEVSQFLSYEGTITATDGLAENHSSTDIGVAQQDPTPPSGSGSLGLLGAGGRPSDFSWTRIEESYSPGVSNPGQFLGIPNRAPGIAIDSLAVTFLPDSDRDGLADRSDPDDDNDGLSDDEEIALGTDPLSADSDNDNIADGDEDQDRDGFSNLAELRITLTDPRDNQSRFSFALLSPSELELTTLIGRQYLLEQSNDLKTWSTVTQWEGTGTSQSIKLPNGARKQFYRISVELSP